MSQFIYRLAVSNDIPQLQVIRGAVKENILSDPRKVTAEMYEDYLDKCGRTWLCESEGKIVGFAAANRETANIWALFIDPEFEGLGIGQKLMSQMLTWLAYLGHTQANLSTDNKTRAARFYLKNGWKLVKQYDDGEIEFIKELRK
ncbi:GNAT family N-acetyltransferase [Pseudoalteromonas xiamenensis]|uniref:GNAT family N-acetyltransferase n=1 Tax=Pseudoalteromonas xiamenensis TaxID=882626 RepID=UPI0035EBA601